MSNKLKCFDCDHVELESNLESVPVGSDEYEYWGGTFTQVNYSYVCPNCGKTEMEEYDEGEE